MAEDFRDFHAAHRRRDLLLILLGSLDYSCNESLLRTALREMGYLTSSMILRDDVFWLAERQLVKTREIGDGLLIATLLTRGRDVAEGAESVDGVARPDPGRT